jgi:uncharacterized protein YqcC (DUF446 family)
MRTQAGAIEAEMRRIGYWQAEPLKPEAYRFKQAFAADTMSFPQWLQFVFLPKVRDLAQKGGELPDGSMVGAYAVRELDTDPNADQLVSLLSEFDSLFGTPTFSLAPEPARARFGRTAQSLVWTAVMVALGLVFAGYASRLVPKERLEIYSFSAHDPASAGYETIQMSAAGDGPPGRVRMESLVLQMHLRRAPVAGGDMTLDLPAMTYTYRDPGGQARTGPLTAEAVVAWMRRCGATGDAARLAAEADALARFAQRVKQEPAAVFASLRRGTAPAAGTTQQAADVAAAEPFRLSATSNLERDRPGRAPPWVRFGVPAVVWLAGLCVIVMLNRR